MLAPIALKACDLVLMTKGNKSQGGAGLPGLRCSCRLIPILSCWLFFYTVKRIAVIARA